MPTAFKIPTQEAEAPNARSGDDLFPEGTWRGRIQQTRISEIRPGDNNDFLLEFGRGDGARSYEYAEIASIQLGEIEALLEDQEDVGRQKFFDEKIVLQVDDHRWDDPSVDIEEHWPLRKTRRRLTNLAMAVGAAENSDGSVGPTVEFDELFTATDAESGSGLAGAEVFFTTKHRGGTYWVDAAGNLVDADDPAAEEEREWKKHYLDSYQQAV